MDDRRLVTVLAGVFASITAVLFLLGLLVSPVALGVAVPFAATAYLLWQHASGRLDRRARRTDPDDRRGPGRAGDRRSRFGPGAGDRRRARRERRPPDGDRNQTREEAYRVLGLDPGASRADVKRAYRERVKRTHPDRGGNEHEFKRVTAAYERLLD